MNLVFDLCLRRKKRFRICNTVCMCI